MADNTTPSELRGIRPKGTLGLDAGGKVILPDPPKLTPELKALGVTGFKWDSEIGDYIYVTKVKKADPEEPGNGSGGGTKKAPPDPYAPVVRSFFSAYYKIWGTLPPPGYVETSARKMNLYEFIEQERKKPAFRKTKTYRDEAARFAAARDQLLGYY